MPNKNEINILLNKLGGVNEIYSFIISKGIEIQKASIYKWKTNGIPHRYRNLITELATTKNINIDDNSIELVDSSDPINPDVPNNIDNKNNTKFSYSNLFLLFLGIVLIINSFYFFNTNSNIKNELSIVSKKTLDLGKNINKKDFEVLVKNNSSNILNNEKILQENKKLSYDTKLLLENSIEEFEKRILNIEKNIKSTKRQNIYYNDIDTYKILTYLLFLKQNLSNNIVVTKNIQFIKDFLIKNEANEEAIDALENIKILQNQNILNKSELMTNLFLIIEDSNDKVFQKEEPKKILDKFIHYSKKFIRIEKIEENNTKPTYKVVDDLKQIFYSNNLNLLHDYRKILEKNSNLKKDSNYIFWKQDLINYITFEESIDVLISWILNKGYE